MDPPGLFSFGNLVLLMNVVLLFYSKLSLGTWFWGRCPPNAPRPPDVPPRGGLMGLVEVDWLGGYGAGAFRYGLVVDDGVVCLGRLLGAWLGEDLSAGLSLDEQSLA